MFDFLFLSSPFSSFVLSLSVFSSVLLFSYSFTLPSVLFSYSPSFSLLPSPPGSLEALPSPVMKFRLWGHSTCSSVGARWPLCYVIWHIHIVHAWSLLHFILFWKLLGQHVGVETSLALDRSDFKPYPLHLE